MINTENERENKKTRTKSRRRTSKIEILRKEIVTNEESDSDDLSEVSFSISKPSDVDSLCENISNKSKDDMKFDYEPIIATNRKVYTFKEKKAQEFSFRKRQKIKINRDIFQRNNISDIMNKKNKLIFMPILNENKRRKEDSKIKI